MYLMVLEDEIGKEFEACLYKNELALAVVGEAFYGSQFGRWGCPGICIEVTC